MTIVKLTPPAPDQALIDLLEKYLEKAKKGEITDLVMVGAYRDEDGTGYFHASNFEDRWRLLGALAYATGPLANVR